MKYICVGKPKNTSAYLLCSLRPGLKEPGRNCPFQHEANPSPKRYVRKGGSRAGRHSVTKSSHSFNSHPETSWEIRLDIT